jgi:hypothetical protein
MYGSNEDYPTALSRKRCYGTAIECGGRTELSIVRQTCHCEINNILWKVLP